MGGLVPFSVLRVAMAVGLSAGSPVLREAAAVLPRPCPDRTIPRRAAVPHLVVVLAVLAAAAAAAVPRLRPVRQGPRVRALIELYCERP